MSMQCDDSELLPAPPSLTELPIEVILHILQYLNVRFITEVLAEVSTLFRDIAADDSTWRIRIHRRWRGQYPALPPPSTFNWTQACIAREEETKAWTSVPMVHYTNSTSHYASVDTIHITDDVIVSGSRDRGIHLWPLYPGKEEEGTLRPVAKLPDAHQGWVWSLSSTPHNDLVSGAWDSKIKFWKVSPTGLKETRSDVRLKTAVLTTDIHENRVVAGTFDKKVVQMDLREPASKMTYFMSHKKPVLKVKVTETHILSLAEDSVLSVHDRRAGRRLKKVEIPSPPPEFGFPANSFPLSMDLLDNMLYIGDSSAYLYLLDSTHNSYDIVQRYKTGHTGRLSSVVCNLGSTITASTDGTVKIFTPTRTPRLISTLQSGERGQITSLAYRHGVMAAAASNNTVNIYTPASS